MSTHPPNEGFNPRSTMCHDCAFRPDSPEMKEFKEEYPSKMATVIEDLDYFLRGQSHWKPFICHQGMPTGEGGPPNYEPWQTGPGWETRFPVCAGYLKKWDALAKRINAEIEESAKQTAAAQSAMPGEG